MSFNRQESIDKQTAESAEIIIENHQSKSKTSPPNVQKRSLFSYGPSLVRSNFHAHSGVKESSNLKVRARPFDEFVITPIDNDGRTSIPIKTDGNPTPRTDK